jgi:hypothetical protein
MYLCIYFGSNLRSIFFFHDESSTRVANSPTTKKNKVWTFFWCNISFVHLPASSRAISRDTDWKVPAGGTNCSFEAITRYSQPHKAAPPPQDHPRPAAVTHAILADPTPRRILRVAAACAAPIPALDPWRDSHPSSGIYGP